MSLRRCLLAPFGVLVGHTLGYWLAELPAGLVAGSAVGHDHLPFLASVAFPLALGALLFVLLRRGEKAASTGVRSQALLQVSMFLGLELWEHVTAGGGPQALLHAPEVGLGLALQVLVAALLVWVDKAAGSASSPATSIRNWPPSPFARIARLRPASRTPFVLVWLPPQLTRRGPPSLPAVR